MHTILKCQNSEEMANASGFRDYNRIFGLIYEDGFLLTAFIVLGNLNS